MNCEAIISKLRKRITIQSVTRVSDGVGGFTESWSTFATRFAAIEPTKAFQIRWADHLEHRVTHKITLRYLSGVTSDMRVVYGSRTFHIRAIRNPEERNRFLELICEEGAAS